MTGQTVCPRCGARDSFIEGYLPETCVCLRCQSQLDWREIPGCGPDCKPLTEPAESGPESGGDVTCDEAPPDGDLSGWVTDR